MPSPGVEQAGDKYYVLLRNPHGTKGVNSHEDGELRMMSETYADGYSRLELRDFSRLFTFVFTNHYDMTRARAETLAEAKTITRAYGESVRKIAETLESSDSTLLFFRNSDQFTKFKKEAAALNQLMQSPAPTPEKLYKRLDAFFNAAEAYSRYCETDKKLSLFKDGQRAYIRYQAAKIAQEMRPVVQVNRSRTLKDKWDEFSYSAAQKKVHVPADHAAALEALGNMSDNMAALLTRQEGSFRDAENRTKVYRYLREFVESDSGRKLAEKAKPELDEGQRFDLIQKNAHNVCAMYLLSGHGDEILNAMRSDGYLDRHPDLAARLQLQRDVRIPFAAPAPAAEPARARQAVPPQKQR